MKFDLPAAVAHNAKFLGLATLPSRTQERLAVLLAQYQEDHGLEPDGAYDSQTERSLNGELGELLGTAVGIVSSVPGPQGFTADQVVERLRFAVEFAAKHPDVHYGMGGGAHWSAPNPWDVLKNRFPRLCDCIGLYHWAAGTVRGRYNTDGCVDDAYMRSGGRFVLDVKGRKRRGPERVYVGVEPHDMRPGDLIVFAGRDDDGDGQRDAAGHGGGIVRVDAGAVLHVDDWADGVGVVQTRWQQRAARETTAAIFDKERTVVLRCKRVRYA